jgi:Tfp pilus assembly protein PilF
MNRLIIFILLLSFSTILFSSEEAFEEKVKAKGHFNLSLVLIKNNSFNEAVVELEKAIAFYPENYIYHYNLGTLLLRKKEYKKAVDSFLNTIKYKNDYQPGYYNLGLSYYFLREYILAADYFQKAISLDQYDIDAHINLGLSYKSLKKYEAAESEFQKVLLIDPQNIPALLDLAVTYKEMGEVKKSLKILNKILVIDPKNKEALYNLSLIRLNKSVKSPVKKIAVSKKDKNIIASNSDEKNIYLQKSSITGKTVSLPLKFLSNEDKTRFVKSENKDNSQDFYVNKSKEIELSRNLEKSYEILETTLNEKTSVENQITQKLKNEISSLKEMVKNEIKGSFQGFMEELKKQAIFNAKLAERVSKLEKTISQKDSLKNYFEPNVELENFNFNSEINSFDKNENIFVSPDFEIEDSVSEFNVPLFTESENLDVIDLDNDNISLRSTSVNFSLNQKINVNKDSAKVMIKKGMPENIAANIVWVRENDGKFLNNESLLNVPEMNTNILEKIKDYIIY